MPLCHLCHRSPQMRFSIEPVLAIVIVFKLELSFPLSRSLALKGRERLYSQQTVRTSLPPDAGAALTKATFESGNSTMRAATMSFMHGSESLPPCSHSSPLMSSLPNVGPATVLPIWKEPPPKGRCTTASAFVFASNLTGGVRKVNSQKLVNGLESGYHHAS